MGRSRDGCAGSARFCAVVLLLLLLTSQPVLADQIESAGNEARTESAPVPFEDGAGPGLPGHVPAPWSGDVWTRSQLTGDWAGTRNDLARSGLTFFGDITQYYYRLDQVLYADADDPKRTWSLNSDVGLSDGNPNPIRWFANLSLVGTSPIRGREADTLGIGYYHLSVSNLPILNLHGFGAEDGVELFYNVAVTPWFHLTPDLQVLDPAQSNNATALLVGIRGRLSF